jgi:hypothetical protein
MDYVFPLLLVQLIISVAILLIFVGSPCLRTNVENICNENVEICTMKTFIISIFAKCCQEG